MSAKNELAQAREARDQELKTIHDAAAALARRFPMAYWRQCDKEEKYPWDFVNSFADAGWMGILLPEEYRGMGLGVTEAGLMLHEVARSGAGMSGASAVHFYVFPPMPIVRHGSADLKHRYLPQMAEGKLLMSFGVTEPTAGVDTSRIRTKAERKGDRWIVNGRKVWMTNAQNAKKILLLARTSPRDEKRPPDGMTLFVADLDRKCRLAECRVRLAAAAAVGMQAAELYDAHQPCGPSSNAAKYLRAEAGFRACDRAMQAPGGHACAKEYHLERLWREVRLLRLAPVAQEMVMNCISKKVLGLPKSY